jgi:hypothetical protein
LCTVLEFYPADLKALLKDFMEENLLDKRSHTDGISGGKKSRRPGQ